MRKVLYGCCTNSIPHGIILRCLFS
jgi:hypothetical protein